MFIAYEVSSEQTLSQERPLGAPGALARKSHANHAQVGVLEKLFALRAQSGRARPRSQQNIAFSTDLRCILASRRSWQNNKQDRSTSSASPPFSRAETSCANATRAART